MDRFELGKVLGAATKGIIHGFISQYVPIAPDIVTAALGYYLKERQTGFWRDFGEGLFIASVAQLISPFIQGIAGRLTAPSAAPSATAAPKTIEVEPLSVAKAYAGVS